MTESGTPSSEERLQFLTAAVDAALDGIALVGADLRFQYVNTAFCRLIGRQRRDDLIGQSATAFLSEDNLKAAVSHVVEGRGKGRPQTLEMELHAEDGRTVPIEVSISTLRPDPGRPDVFLAIVRDVTERKQAEATLRLKNALLETQREASIDGILVVDGAGRMISFNRRFVTLWGIPDDVIASGSDELALQAVTDKLADPEGFLERVRHLYQHPSEESRDEIALRDGRTFDRYSAPVIDSEGTHYGRVWHFRDVTGRKRTEEALQRARDEAQAATRELQAARARDVEIGARIQQTLLLSPPPTGAPDFEIATLAVPSRVIDGDFYEFLLHPNRCLDIIFGDVMGKGVPAALLSAGAKTEFLRSLAQLLVGSPRGTIPQPASIVDRVHQVLTPHLLALDSFVTLSYVRFDPPAQKVTVVDCGSTKLIRRAADTGHVDCLSGFNLPLGFAVSEVYAEAAFEYAVDDVFVLYSDGVTEARNPAGELFGLDRLRDLVASDTGRRPEGLAAAIREAVSAFAGPRALADDLTCVVLKMAPAQTAGDQLPVREFEVASSLKELSRIRAFVHNYCVGRGGCGMGEHELSMLELAVSEVASNIMRHAYHGRADRRIRIGIDAGDALLKVQLTHDGDPFTDDARISVPLVEGAGEGGFGLFIIRQAVDRVDYGEDRLGRQYVRLSKRVREQERNGNGLQGGGG